MATDQEIRDRGFKYIPQQKYLQNPFQLPIAPEPPVTDLGIVNTNAFANSGGDNSYNQAGNAFGYGTPVNEVNVRTFNPQSNDPTGSVANAQLAYNQLGDIKDKSIYSDYADINNQIMDNRQNYQANYNSPYEDSIDLGYQGTLGNNEMYPSEKYPNRFMKGKLNRFRNTVGDAAKFVKGLLPFPLNLATKFLPKQEDRGPGGGTYGIAGLSDDKKAAYNALAGQGYLFGGEQGFKTLTGKNFQATNYVPNQLEMYEKLKDEEELTGFQKKQLLEASAVYKATQKQNKDAADAAAQAAVRETNFASQGKSDPNDQSRAGSSGRRPGSGSGPTTQDSQSKGDPSAGQTGGYSYDSGGREGFGYGLKKGGRAGYFFGGRVNFKNGGLASLL